MILLRSILFAVGFYGVTLALCLPYLVLMLLPRRVFSQLARKWALMALWLAELTIGIRYEVRGWERLPTGPVILASKHQSVWDTLIFVKLFPDCAYVVKRELLWIPFFGWFLWRHGMIGVDRGAGGTALKRLVATARGVITAGRTVVIFPQGTRTPPGAERPYLPGIAALYMAYDRPVVPVALNSGLFWPRRQFVKRPGTIVLEILPPIDPGLDRRTFMARLRDSIEPAARRLEIEVFERRGLDPASERARPSL